MKRTWKKLLIGLGIVILVSAGVIWYVATEKFSDTADRKAAYSLTANDFIAEFRTDNKAANEKYTEKIVSVKGVVSATELADTTVNVKIIDSASTSYIIFAFQDQHLDEAKGLTEGETVVIKGSCSGSVYSKILDTYVISFKRSALDNK